jgi:hypothetical protein
MLRASDIEDRAVAYGAATTAGTYFGTAAVMAETGPGAVLAATVTALGAFNNYDAKVENTKASISAAEEARRHYKDEAIKAGKPDDSVKVEDTAYQARPWHTDPGRALHEDLKAVGAGATSALHVVEHGAQFVERAASEAYEDAAEFITDEHPQ